MEVVKVESSTMTESESNFQVVDDLVTETKITETIREMNDLEMDGEEPDTPSPLMQDNHTMLQHQESYQNTNYDSANDEDSDEEDFDMQVHHESNMKHSDTKDSISSIDSDVSMTFDRRDSTESNNPPEETGSSDDNAKDSGCDVKNSTDNPDEEFEIPDDEMCEKIVEQVEYYFSNDSILKDAFLLKHVRRNKEGFVSLKLVSSFKRVRQLTKDWRSVGYAIKQKSEKIELNDLNTKIRRLEPLPNHDETTPSRTVVATALPYDKYTVENVSELFKKCGEISLIRILRPGGPIPADVRQFINKHPELQQNECALVEFTESSAARKAQNMDEFIIFELVAPKKKTGKKANVTKFVENYKFSNNHDIERSRGGERESKFILKSTAPPFYPRSIQAQTTTLDQQRFVPSSPRKISFGNENYDCYNRRSSNCSSGSDRKFSNCSEGYSSCSEASRRTSACSDMSRRTSSCSEAASRRSSQCSDFCPCSRRMSQCSDQYRRISQCSEHNGGRKFSVGSNYERKYANSPDMGVPMRRISMDHNPSYDRKYSTGSMGYESPNHQGSPRKYSTGFDQMRKLSNTSDQYYNGRKISTDSGYDRRISMDSNCSAPPRSRNNSLICSHGGNGSESVVRTPIGPDGSKGFGSRTRRVATIVPPA